MKRLALIAAPLFLAACLNDPFGVRTPDVEIDPEKKAEAKTANMVITESPAPNSVTRLTRDDRFTIRLDANPTTGIWWSDPVFDASVLRLASNDYVTDPAPEGVVGSGGTTVLTFEAIAPGTTRITSEYSRGGGEVYETLDITVEVTE